MFIEDLDGYAYRLGYPRWLAIAMILIYPATWAIGVYRSSSWILTKCKLCNLPVIKQILFAFFFIVRRLTVIILGIDISPRARIGKGIFISHIGGLIIAANSIIGNYPSFNQWVSVGNAGRGENYGPPIIGNNVLFGAGSAVIGKIIVGNNVMIGANAVIVKSTEDNAVVVGVPGKTISYEGSLEHIHYRDKQKFKI